MDSEEGPQSPDEIAAYWLDGAVSRAEAHVKARQRELSDMEAEVNRAEALLTDAYAQLDAIRLVKTRNEAAA